MSDWHWYRAHGLLIRSQLDLPELAPAEPGEADVTCRLGPEASEAVAQTSMDTPTAGGFRLGAPGPIMRNRGRFHVFVPNGREIFITPLAGAEMGTMRLYVIGSVMAMILHQRGRLVLHGAAIARPGGLSLVVGPSGAGKSTLAAHFVRHGFPALCDDVVAPQQMPDGSFQAWPGSRAFKMHRDALERMGTAPDDLRPVNARRLKHFLPNPHAGPDVPQPIVEVIALESAAGPPVLTSVEGFEAMQVLVSNTYRGGQPMLLGDGPAHFRRLSQLCNSVPVRRLTRSWDPDRIGETVAFLSRHWDVDGPAARERAGG